MTVGTHATVTSRFVSNGILHCGKAHLTCYSVHLQDYESLQHKQPATSSLMQATCVEKIQLFFFFNQVYFLFLQWFLGGWRFGACY